jgi:hypothetical protein
VALIISAAKGLLGGRDMGTSAAKGLLGGCDMGISAAKGLLGGRNMGIYPLGLTFKVSVSGPGYKASDANLEVLIDMALPGTSIGVLSF